MRAPRFSAVLAALSGLALAISPVAVSAQITQVDPNEVIDADLDQPDTLPPPDTATPAPGVPDAADADPAYQPDYGAGVDYDAPADTADTAEPQVAGDPTFGQDYVVPAASDEATYQEDDLIGAAEGVFGKGAQGLASMIEDILSKQGRPNAYIVGREASGAFVVGLRYGSGTLYHKIEGERDVYWTGPSVGFDAGGNASKTFTLVYNLYDSQDLYKRFPAGEGTAYLVGGFTASYLRRGDVVLIPIRLGVGARLGVNVGYMRFSEKQRWLPF